MPLNMTWAPRTVSWQRRLFLPPRSQDRGKGITQHLQSLASEEIFVPVYCGQAEAPAAKLTSVKDSYRKRCLKLRGVFIPPDIKKVKI